MLWPDTTERADEGYLTIGGMSLVDLVERFGSPLYVYDEATLRGQAARFRDAFRTVYPNSRVVYAAKAYASPGVISVLSSEGLGLDVVSGGELHAGLMAGVEPRLMTFHGNNKQPHELREAIQIGVGHIAIDNVLEIDLIREIAAEVGTSVPCLLRLNPGVDVHTHAKIMTGNIDSKFGFPISTGDAARAVALVMDAPEIDLAGYHAHIGSQLFEVDALQTTIASLVTFAAEMRDLHGVVPRVISPGGGFGVAYGNDQVPAPVEEWSGQMAETLFRMCHDHGLPAPELVIEPGRSLVARAGVAVYQVGAIKEIGGVRTYVSVDGGMADNIRPALYDAVYEVALANRRDDSAETAVTIAGRYCESGDVLIRDAKLPPLRPGDLLALPASGAYCLAMASNYNLTTRPAVVIVQENQARLIRRRETYEDILRPEIAPELALDQEVNRKVAPVGNIG